MPSDQWIIERNSGRYGGHWRTVWSGLVEAKARVEFDKRHAAMRQGGLRLIRPDGHTEFIVTSPRLRTRW